MTTPLTLRSEAEALAAPLPPLLAQAEHLASTVLLGDHGRRRAGMRIDEPRIGGRIAAHHDLHTRPAEQLFIDVEAGAVVEIAQHDQAVTGGEMFQATDPEALQEIFRTIDDLETARYETTVSTWYRERMAMFALPALLLVLGEALLAATWLRRIP